MRKWSTAKISRVVSAVGQAVNAVLAALVLIGVVALTADQISGVVLAVSAVGGILVVLFDPDVPGPSNTVAGILPLLMLLLMLTLALVLLV